MAELITVELVFVKDAPTYVEGRDAKGFSRAFEKRTHDFWIDGSTLFVKVDKRLWERRMARTPVVKPMRSTAKKVVRRKCLICKHEFDADPAHRICDPCKTTANWKSGGDYNTSY